MSWVPADAVFDAADERAERTLAAARAERMAIIAAEAERTRPEHLVDVTRIVGDVRHRWRVECVCGWRMTVADEDAGWELAAWHR